MPLNRDHEASRNTRPYSRRPPFESPLVVVIDDDDAVRDSMCLLLEANGLEAACFSSGEEFLSSDVLSRTGCLLLDYHMPGMTGLEVLDELRRRGLVYPTVLITGLSDGTIRSRALAAGAIDVLRKGDTQARIIDATRRALAQWH